jgi:hypothetical protein
MNLQTTAQALFIALIVLGVLFALSALGRERHVRKLEDALVRILGARVGHPEDFAAALSDAEDTFVHLHARIVHARVVLAPLPWKMEGQHLPDRKIVTPERSRSEMGEWLPECSLPPAGWKCSRVAGHTGPCATSAVKEAHPTAQSALEKCKLRFGRHFVEFTPEPMPKVKMPIHDLKDTPVEDRTWRGKAFLDLTPSQQSQAIADWMALSVRDNLLVRWINDDADSRWDIFKDALAIRGAAQ